jgi:hypothetical protein
MESSLVPDQHMDRLVLRRDEILKLGAVPLLIHSRKLTEMGLSTDHIQCAVEIVSLVFDLPGDNRTLYFASPQPPHFGV